MKKLLLGNLIALALILSIGLSGQIADSDSAEAAINPAVDSSNGYLVPANWADTGSLNIFTNFTSWPHSDNQKPGDLLAQFIYQLKAPVNQNWVPDGSNAAFLTIFQSLSVNPSAFTLIDINGDGLTDMVYREQTYIGGKSGSSDGYWGPLKMAVWSNQGNNNFAVTYKCYVDTGIGWYGDCAAQ